MTLSSKQSAVMASPDLGYGGYEPYCRNCHEQSSNYAERNQSQQFFAFRLLGFVFRATNARPLKVPCELGCHIQLLTRR